VATVQERKAYWDDHPIGAEPFDAPFGSREFYEQYRRYYDRFYAYKYKTFKYGTYKDQKVLEIGCGLGIDSVKLAQAGAILTCIDLSETSVRSTRGLLDQLNLRADVRQGDAEHLEFPDSSFDVVYAYGVLMLVADERRAMHEVYRVLKPGGEALVVLYHRRSWFWLLARLSRTNIESEAGDPPINRVHTLAEARELFRAFSKVEIRLDRFPLRTRRRKGVAAFLFNWIIVPLSWLVPRPLMRRFGWHLIIKAVK